MATALERAVERIDEILLRSHDGHSHVTVRRDDLRAVLLAATFVLPARETEVAYLREKLGVCLAGDRAHRSDCSVHNAPAFEPTPCDCGTRRAA